MHICVHICYWQYNTLHSLLQSVNSPNYLRLGGAGDPSDAAVLLQAALARIKELETNNVAPSEPSALKRSQPLDVVA